MGGYKRKKDPRAVGLFSSGFFLSDLREKGIIFPSTNIEFIFIF